MTKMPPTKAAGSLSHHAGSGKRYARKRARAHKSGCSRFAALQAAAVACCCRAFAPFGQDDDFGHPAQRRLCNLR
jgi:hypothetical protein